MSILISVLSILLILGVLITVHEFGHFIAARLCRIKVREFAIGMGPAVYRRQKKDAQGNPTGLLFTLRIFPIGGFCDMSEDENSDDPDHFTRKKGWQKLIVLAAGSFMNLIAGFVIFFLMFLVVLNWTQASTTIESFSKGFPYTDRLQAGDRIVAVNGHTVFSYSDITIFVDRGKDAPYTFEVERNGERITVHDIARTIVDETELKKLGLNFARETITLSTALRDALYSCADYVRLVWMSLGDIISQRASAGDLMGPVGMGGVVNDIVSEPEVPWQVRVNNILQLAGLIAVNLAVVNMMPIPGLDGGRILFLFISYLFTLIRKRPLSHKVEGYIHGVTMLLLFGLMIFVFFNDIRRLAGF